MNISKISNQNFGAFVDYNMWDNVQLTPKDVDIIDTTIDIINKTEGRRIDVWGRIGTPNANEPNKLYVKLKSLPLIEDIFTIQQSSPKAQREDYKRHSKWFPLDESLLYNAIVYLHKQNGYIKYCKNHPEHSSIAKEGHGRPEFD